MERIASFCVDHTKLDRGMYLSRQDGDVLTWDIRMKKPNQRRLSDHRRGRTRWSTCLPPTRGTAAYKDRRHLCRPHGLPHRLLPAHPGPDPRRGAGPGPWSSFRFMAAFEGAVPGASEVECGNYRDMDLPKAKAEAAAMLPVLEALTADQLHY